MANERDQETNDAGNVWLHPVTLVLLAVLSLTVLGLATLYSATQGSASDPYFFLRRQLLWTLIAFCTLVIVAHLPLEKLRSLTWPLAAAVLVALVLVLIPGIGVEVNGSRRWIDFGFMRLQVSEFAKIALIFSLAHYLGTRQSDLTNFWKGFLIPSIWIGLICGLVFLQKDFGTTLLLGGIGFLLLYLAGIPLRYLLPSALAGLGAFATAVWHNPVRMNRIMSFLDVEGNRMDGSYQLWQAILAFVAGGVNGVGLGNGRQQQAFLPEAHTDFIFAIIGEELGLVFTLGVVLLFALIFLAGCWHLRRAPNLFQYLVVAGCLLLLSLQSLINLGVVTGLLPTKGISLPFISYGGSNLLAMAIVVGLLANTQRNWRRLVLKGRRRSFAGEMR